MPIGFDHMSLKLRLLSLSIAGQVTKLKDGTRTQHPRLWNFIIIRMTLHCLLFFFLYFFFFFPPISILALRLANAILNEFQSSFYPGGGLGVADKTTHDLLRSLVHLPS